MLNCLPVLFIVEFESPKKLIFILCIYYFVFIFHMTYNGDATIKIKKLNYVTVRMLLTMGTTIVVLKTQEQYVL